MMILSLIVDRTFAHDNTMRSNHELAVEPIGLELAALARPIDFPTLFGNSNPVELEIGMGKGTFILDQVRMRPLVNFFALAWARFVWCYSSVARGRADCLNVRTARAEAHFFFRESVPTASLSVVHTYFPD